MADEAIIQTVVLQGQDDIKAGFAAIQRAGEQMFKTLEASAGASSLQKFALGITGTIAAVTAITGALFKWSESAAQTTTAMGNLADASGTTIENLSTLSAALNISSEKLGAGLTRLAVRVESEWKDIQKSQKDAANLIISDTLAIQNAYLSLERATLSLANADKTAANLQIANANSVKGAQLSLTEAVERLRIAEGGAEDPGFNERLNKEKAALAVKQARLALAESQKKADEDAELAANKLAQTLADKETAFLNLGKAQEQASENSKNSIENLTKFVENLAKGVTDANLKVNVNAENVIKGLVASIGPGVDALKDLKGTFTDVASAPPALQSVMLKLADVFHNTDDAVLKLSVSTGIFGRALGQKMVEELSKGSAAILLEQKRLHDLGLELTKDDQIVGKAFVDSIDKLGNTLSILSTKFGLAFSPSFTALIKEINAAIEGSSATFEALGKKISDTVTPAFVAFFETITGKNLQGNLKLTPEQVIDLNQWKTTFEAVKGVVVGAFSLIAGAARLLASLLNGIFGKDTFSGMDLALGALLIKFGGMLGIIIEIGILLNKLSGGTLFESLSINIDGVSKHFANLKKFIESPFSAEAWDRFWEERKKIIDDVAKQQADIFARAEERKKQSSAEQAQQPIKEALDTAAKAGEEFKARLDTASEAAKNTSGSVSGIGGAADASRDKVKELANEIKLLDAAKGTKQSSAGDGIQVISANKPFVQEPIPAGAASVTRPGMISQIEPAKIVSSAKAFGEFGDQLDKSLSRLSAMRQAWEDFNNVEPADPLVLPDIDTTKFTKSLDDEKKLWDDFNNVEPAKPLQLSAIDGSKFTKSLDEKKKLWDDFNNVELSKPIEVPPPETSKFKDGLKELSSGFDFVTGLPDRFKTLAAAIGELFFEKKKIEIDTSAIDSAGDAVDDLEEQLTSLSETEITITPTITPTVDTTQVDQVPARIAGIFTAGAPTMVSPFRTVADGIITEFNRINQVVDALIAKIAGINIPAPQGGFGGEIGGGFASGGLFSGKPGTDTNLAWLSDFEYIMNPNATRRWGVQFMNMINKMDVRGVVNWASKFTAPKFSTGGLVQWMNANMSPAMIPHFAGGGVNVSPSPQQFAGHFSVDLRTDRGTFRVMAPSNTAKELQRISASERLSSAGPPPNWVGRRGR